MVDVQLHVPVGSDKISKNPNFYTLLRGPMTINEHAETTNEALLKIGMPLFSYLRLAEKGEFDEICAFLDILMKNHDGKYMCYMVMNSNAVDYTDRGTNALTVFHHALQQWDKGTLGTDMVNKLLFKYHADPRVKPISKDIYGNDLFTFDTFITPHGKTKDGLVDKMNQLSYWFACERSYIDLLSFDPFKPITYTGNHGPYDMCVKDTPGVWVANFNGIFDNFFFHIFKEIPKIQFISEDGPNKRKIQISDITIDIVFVPAAPHSHTEVTVSTAVHLNRTTMLWNPSDLELHKSIRKSDVLKLADFTKTLSLNSYPAILASEVSRKSVSNDDSRTIALFNSNGNLWPVAAKVGARLPSNPTSHLPIYMEIPIKYMDTCSRQLPSKGWFSNEDGVSFESFVFKITSDEWEDESGYVTAARLVPARPMLRL